MSEYAPNKSHPETEQCCFCNCGNVIINGNECNTEDVFVSQTSAQNFVTNFYGVIYNVTPGGIEANQINSLEYVSKTQSTFEVFCSKCNVGYSVVIGRKNAYICPLNDLVLEKRSSKHDNLFKKPFSSAPPNLRRFVVECTKNPEKSFLHGSQSEYTHTSQFYGKFQNSEEDDDMSLMFSSTKEVIVGSFVEPCILELNN